LGVKPFARTVADAALSPSVLLAFCVNAGSGAARVVVERVDVLVLVVCVGVVCVLVFCVVVGCVCVAVDCVSGGALAFVTVFVPEPQAESSRAAHKHSAGTIVCRVGLRIFCTVFVARPRAPRLRMLT
jgi:hypothetical protein